LRRQPPGEERERQDFAGVMRQAFTTPGRQAFVERLSPQSKTVLLLSLHRLVVANWLEKGL
jgi:hypothetical protein